MEQPKSQLVKAREAVELAQHRRDEQALIVAKLINPDQRAFAEQILKERDRTLLLACMCRAILELTPGNDAN